MKPPIQITRGRPDTSNFVRRIALPLLVLSLGLALIQPRAVDALTFTDVSEAAGIFEYNLSWGAAWGDYDRDGYIDVMTVGHLGSICQLWHNNGDGTFTDVTTAAGMLTADGDAHGPCWADLDNDGDLDLYVAKGTNKEDKPINYNDLWRNNGDGTFTNIAVSSGVTGIGCPNRGSSAVDYDNDGDLDLFIPSFFIHGGARANLLYRNDGDFQFTDVATAAGIREGFRNWAAAWTDYDRDGFIDFFFTEIDRSLSKSGGRHLRRCEQRCRNRHIEVFPIAEPGEISITMAILTSMSRRILLTFSTAITEMEPLLT